MASSTAVLMENGPTVVRCSNAMKRTRSIGIQSYDISIENEQPTKTKTRLKEQTGLKEKPNRSVTGREKLFVDHTKISLRMTGA